MSDPIHDRISALLAAQTKEMLALREERDRARHAEQVALAEAAHLRRELANQATLTTTAVTSTRPPAP